MNWDQVQGNWKQVKGKAKQMWGDFTDDELDVMEGKSEELVGRLQTKYGYSREKAQEEADRWVRSLIVNPDIELRDRWRGRGANATVGDERRGECRQWR